MNNNVHPPTALCSGNIDPHEPDKPRVLLTNPVTERGSVHSTDQTAQGRPEWIFPRCPANMEYMLNCSRIITEYDEEKATKPLPKDCTILRRDIWGDGDPLEFVVRVHTTGSIKRTLERSHIHHECTHGIIVVVPCNPMVVHMLEGHVHDGNHGEASQPDDATLEECVRKPLDMLLVKLLVEEERSMEQAMRGMMAGHSHEHHHHHGHGHD